MIERLYNIKKFKLKLFKNLLDKDEDDSFELKKKVDVIKKPLNNFKTITVLNKEDINQKKNEDLVSLPKFSPYSIYIIRDLCEKAARKELEDIKIKEKEKDLRVKKCSSSSSEFFKNQKSFVASSKQNSKSSSNQFYSPNNKRRESKVIQERLNNSEIKEFSYSSEEDNISNDGFENNLNSEATLKHGIKDSEDIKSEISIPCFRKQTNSKTLSFLQTNNFKKNFYKAMNKLKIKNNENNETNNLKINTNDVNSEYLFQPPENNDLILTERLITDKNQYIHDEQLTLRLNNNNNNIETSNSNFKTLNSTKQDSRNIINTAITLNNEVNYLNTIECDSLYTKERLKVIDCLAMDRFKRKTVTLLKADKKKSSEDVFAKICETEDKFKKRYAESIKQSVLKKRILTAKPLSSNRVLTKNNKSRDNSKNVLENKQISTLEYFITEPDLILTKPKLPSVTIKYSETSNNLWKKPLVNQNKSYYSLIKSNKTKISDVKFNITTTNNSKKII